MRDTVQASSILSFIGNEANRLSDYHIADPSLRFHYRYVLPYRSLIELGNSQAVLKVLEKTEVPQRVPLRVNSTLLHPVKKVRRGADEVETVISSPPTGRCGSELPPSARDCRRR
jgi:hypothetical protein